MILFQRVFHALPRALPVDVQRPVRRRKPLRQKVGEHAHLG
jgi:hypothetical protein